MGLPQKQQTEVGPNRGQPAKPDFFGGPPMSEDEFIRTMTKRSGWILLAIGLLFVADHQLPQRSYEDEAIEFIHAGNRLHKIQTRTTSFRPHEYHRSSSFFSRGKIRINALRITGTVASYQLDPDPNGDKYEPEFSPLEYVSLMYVVLILSLLQLIPRLPLFARMGFWLFSVGSVVGYLLMIIAIG